MNSIYVLDRNFKIQGIIDEYVSCIWRPAYYSIGDFELYLGAKKELFNLLKVNYYLVRSSDITVKNGITTYKKVMIIKNLILKTDVENGDYLSVTGKELKYILSQRVVWSQTILNCNVEEGIRQLVTENAISPTDTNRVIPDLVLGELSGLTETFKKQITAKSLHTAIIDICTTYNYGWDIYIHNDKLVLSVYAGLDRSYNQTDRAYVVFSDTFDNLFSTEYELNTEKYANTSLIGGEGEGVERIYTSINTNYSGWNRYEYFTDARDISQNKDSDDEIPLSQYITLLQQRGSEKLAELSNTEAFMGEVVNDMVFIYGKDYKLGDVVTVISDYGLVKNVRVISAIESDDSNGTKLIPQFLF